MRLSGSGASDPRWLEKILKHPPSSLSTLEYWVGPLDVDFAGDEGMGMVTRDIELAPEGGNGRGAMRPEIRILSADFAYDLYHEDAHRPRDMSLRSLAMRLDVPHAAVAQLLEAQFGAGRVFTDASGRIVEYGRWFYLRDHRGMAYLTYEVQQPEWAIPRPERGALENLLHTLHDRLICDDELAPIYAALEPLASAAGAVLSNGNPGQINLSFRPAIPLASVLEALRWSDPVSSSSDVHQSSWRVYPHRPELPWSAPHVKQWFIEVRLAGRPRGPDDAVVPQLGRAGASPLYDVRDSVTPVMTISVRANSQ